MKEFKQFIKEAEESLDANPETKKQINKVKYKVQDNTHIQKFRVSIHPELANWLADMLKGKDYKFERTNNSFILNTQGNETGRSLQDMIFTELNNAFVANNKDVIKFVGSDLIGDFIDSDFAINIDLMR
jgi:uncharacterized membrane-anchored protein YjiN (DUF445 family)